jgi:pilus assembly protein CpaF
MKTHDLFTKPSAEGRDFSSILREVQEFISAEYSGLIAQGSEESKAQVKRYVLKYLQDHRLAVIGMSSDELVDALYTEMAEFGFLTKYIYGSGVEEIDVNSWRDIEIQYSGGLTEKLKEHFESPEHAVAMIRRMLHISGTVLDNSNPVVTGHLSKNIRIAAMKSPVVDEDVGVAASIRVVNPQSMKKADFVRGGTATDQMLDFLSLCLRYGISICVAGATSSGKTTVAGWLLTTIPDNKRVFTIESGSREVDLVREKDGHVVNSVVHTLTRDSENERQCITQISLLDISLRFNPDLVFVGEMRGAEANAAQEAARTGVAVLTTIHSNSCEATYRRMVSLCKRAVDMSDQTLMDYVTEAYPIVVFCKQLENKKRRLMEIAECEILPDGTRRFNTLFRYVIDENHMDGDETIISGHHEAVCSPSRSLQKRLVENGMPSEKLAQFVEAEAVAV